MPRRFFLCLTTALALIGMIAPAQDFQREGPKAVTPVAPANPVPTESSAKPPDDNQVLLKELKGVIFVPTPHDVAEGGTRASGVVLRGVKVPAPKKFTACVQPYLGKILTRGKLNALIADVISFYRKHDHPIVDVIVPQQEITSGVVQLVVLEGCVSPLAAPP